MSQFTIINDVILRTKIKNSIERVHEESSFEKKSYLFLRVLKIIDNHSTIIFNNVKYEQFISALGNKLLEFEKDTDINKNNKYNIIYKKYLNKYFNYNYDFQCQAYTLSGSRCKKIRKNNSDHFCGTHDNKYLPKIINFLSDVLIFDLSMICISYIFI